MINFLNFYNFTKDVKFEDIKDILLLHEMFHILFLNSDFCKYCDQSLILQSK